MANKDSDVSITASYTCGNKDKTQDTLDQDHQISVAVKTSDDKQTYLSSLRDSLNSVQRQINDYLTLIVEEDQARGKQQEAPKKETVGDSQVKKLKKDH